MKKIILLVLVSLFLTSCVYTGTTVSEGKNKSTVNTAYGSTNNSHEIYEFEYKGHTYIYSTVHNGIAMAHAGHCKCNTKHD